jgi:D-alanyl-D-alanine carboxypeptidase (penicillin-binding protein 5/6)
MLPCLRRLAAILAVLLAVAGLAAGPATAAPRAPTVVARAAVLVDAGTGTVLWQRRAHTPMLVASTTKILTALVAEAAYPPTRLFTVPLAAEQVEGTRFGYRTGMRVRRHDLLATLLLTSANDAAETLAAAYPRGGRAGFLRAMQAMAASLGCTDSTWRSPSGLEAPGHRASAADLAIVGRQLLAEPELARLARAETTRYRWPDGRVQIIANHNHFVADGRDPGALGVKTGYTNAAGHTIVAAERRAGRTLIAVALGMPNLRTELADVHALFRYGFAVRPQPGVEVLGAAAAAGRGPSSARSSTATDLPGKGGPTPPGPGLSAVVPAGRGLAARLLAEPVVVAVAGGVLLFCLGMLAVAVHGARGGPPRRGARRAGRRPPGRRTRAAPAPGQPGRGPGARAARTGARRGTGPVDPVRDARAPTADRFDPVRDGRAPTADRYGDRAP